MKNLFKRQISGLAGAIFLLTGSIMMAEIYPLGLPLRVGGSGVDRGVGAVTLSESRVTADAGLVLSLQDTESVVWHPLTGLIPSDPTGALAAGGDGGVPHMISWVFAITRPTQGDLWIKVSGAVTRREFLYWTLLLPESEQASQSGFELPQTEDASPRWLRVRSISMGRSGDYRFFVRMPREPVRIEGMAILPDGVEPEKAKVTRTTTVMDTGEVLTGTVQLPDARAIRGAEVTGWNGQGEVRLALVLGSGDWHWIEEGRLPEGVTVSAGDTVRAKVILSRTGSGSPAISGIDLRVDGGYWPILESTDATVHLDQSGGIFRIRDRMNGRDLLWPTTPVFPFSLDLKEFGQAEWVRYSGSGREAVKMAGGRETATPEAHAEAMAGVAGERLENLGDAGMQVGGYEATDDGGYRFRYTVDEAVEVHITHQLIGGEYRLGAKVVNESDYKDVIRFTFPRLEALRLGSNGFDDDQLRMHNFGHLRRAPGLGTVRDTKYPGPLNLPWEALDDDSGGLALISLDPLGRNLGFASRAPLFFGDIYNLETTISDTVPAVGGEADFTYVLLIHPFRWHVAADYYRDWYHEHWQHPEYPGWLQESDGFLNVQWQLGGTDFMDMVDRGRQSMLANLNYMHVWGQMTGPNGGGCCSTFPEPSPLFGGSASLVKGLAALDNLGVRTGFYFLPDRLDWNHMAGIAYNGAVWQEEYPETTVFPEPELLDEVRWVDNPDGEPIPFVMTEEEKEAFRKQVAAFRAGEGSASAGRRWIPTDLTDPRWQDWVADWAQRYVDDWGAHSLYYDVMGTGAVRESFDGRKLDHGKGRWGLGRAETVQRTRERLNELGHTEAAVLVEGGMDLSGQWAAHMVSGLYRNRAAVDDMNQTDISRYSFPDRIFFDGHSNQGNLARVIRVKGAFLNGNRMDLVYTTPVTTGILDGREALRHWLYPAAFRHTLGLEAPVPARVFRMDEPDRSAVLLTVLNDEQVEGRITYLPEDDFSPEYGFLVRTNGTIEAWPFTWNGVFLETAIPDTAFGTLLFVEKANGLEDCLITYISDAHKPDTKGQLYLANPGATELRLRVEGNPQKGKTPEVRDVVVPAGEVTVLEVTPGQDDISGIYTARISDGSGERTLKRRFFPLFDQKDFANRLNDTETYSFPTFRLGPGEEANHESFGIHLQPGETYRYRIEYFKTAGESQISSASLNFHLLDEKPDRNHIPIPVENAWAVAEGEIQVPENAFSSSLFVYNWRSTRDLWIRSITFSK